MDVTTQLKQAQAALAEAETRYRYQLSNKTILCACGKSHAIRNLDLIVTHWYVQPHGCTDGDYWVEGEWDFVCPKGVRNRLLFDDYDIPWRVRDTTESAEQGFKRIHGALFKTKVDEHNGPDKGKNNYYVDQHRKKFGLREKTKRD